MSATPAKTGEPIRAADLYSFMESSRGLERDYMGELARSNRRAWLVAGIGALAGLAGLGAGAASLYRPVPIPDPVVLSVDSSTGTVNVLTTLSEQTMTQQEIVDKTFLNAYVLRREAYDWNTLRLDYRITALMSSPEVQSQYRSEHFAGEHDRQQQFHDHTRVEVETISRQINGQGQGLVRFRTRLAHRNGMNDAWQHWIATIGYRYVEAPMSEEDRMWNALGFQVTSYRTDPESL